MIEAVTPKEAKELHSELANSEIIEIVNNFIIQRYSGEDSISITKDEIKDEILSRYIGAEKIRREKNFETNKEWDISFYYKNKGWSVSVNNDVLWFFNK